MTDKVDNQALLQDLFEGLRIRTKLSQDILQTLKEENKALRDMATQELFRLVTQKNNLLAKIQYLDESLKNTIKGLLGNDASTTQLQTASDHTTFTLSRLAPLLPKEKADTVKQYSHNLRQLRHEIQTQNFVNHRFTHDTLSCLNDAIKLITGSVAANSNYSMPGLATRHQRTNPSLISRKV